MTLKKYFNVALSAILLFPAIGFCQQDHITKAAQLAQVVPVIDTAKKWDLGGLISVTFTQASFTNWAAGGQNSLGLASMASLHANYKKNKFSWLNDVELAYGFQRIDEQALQKTVDQIAVTSNVGYKLFDHTSASFLTNFQSQFQPGYTNVADTVLLSDFMSPAYWILAAGLTYSPNKALIVFVSPVTARFTFVENQQLANQGAFGVTPAVYNASGNLVTPGKNELTEVGAYIKADYTKEIIKNITLATNLELFSNYLKDPQNIVVNWSTFIQLKVNKLISATITTQLIYDNNILVPIYQEVNGVNIQIGKGPRTQFRDLLGVGLAYKL
jgi:hypothetical protein